MAENAPTLRAVLNSLAASLGARSYEELSIALGEVGIFATALGGKTRAKPSKRDLKAAAAFVLLSQIVVYEAVARRTGRVARIDADRVHSWRELHEEYFRRLRGTGYDELFAVPIAALFQQEDGAETVRRTLNAARHLVLSQPGRDLLGQIYHELVPFRLRKEVGAFYTNAAAAQLLAYLAVRVAPASVIDPACGSGTLLLAAYSRLSALHPMDEANGTRRRRLLDQLTGIDVMPFAVGLAAMNLLLQRPNGRDIGVRLAVADSTQLSPDSVVLDWERKTRFTVDRHDIVLMNPPFTRGHIMTSQDKRRLQATFPTLGPHLGGLAGLQDYFLIVAHRLLREGGYLGAVLPASTFGTVSSQGLTSFLLGHFTIDLVILCRQRSAFSEQTNLRELLLLARKQTPSDTHQVIFAVINKSPACWSGRDVERFHAALSQVASESAAVSRLGPELWVHRVAQGKLSQQPRLFHQNLLQTSSRLLRAREMVSKLAGESVLQPFQGVFRHLGARYLLNPRGSFALGFKALNLLPNVEACLKANDVWFIAEREAGAIRVRNRMTLEIVELRLSDTIPCVRRLAGLRTVNSSDAIGRTLSRGGTAAVERLLAGTFEEAEAAGYSKALQTCWQSRCEKTQTHLVMAYKADLGAPGTHLLAAVFDAAAYPAGDAWVFPGLALDEARILALWMNSTFFLVDLLVNRTEQRGSWMRFDKPVLDQLLLLDPTLASGTRRQQLLNLYDSIQSVQVPSLLSQLAQPSRHLIDESILRILGVKRRRAAALAAKCASAAREAVSDLVTMMRGDSSR